jgi:hypothetical protein
VDGADLEEVKRRRRKDSLLRGQIRKIVANYDRIFLTQLILRIENTKTN